MKLKIFVLTMCMMGAMMASAEGVEVLQPECVTFLPGTDLLVVTEATAQQIAWVTLEGKTVKTVKLETASGGFLGLFQTKTAHRALGVCAALDGKTLYATANNGNEGLIFKIDAESGKILETVTAGNYPVSPLISPCGRWLYVSNRFDATVSKYDIETLKLVATGVALRDTVGLAMGENGKYLFAVNLLPVDATEPIGHVSSRVTVFDAKTLAKITDVALPNGASGARGIVASPDGKTIYVTHTIARYQLPTTQLERGWMNTAALTLIDGASGIYINTVLLDDVDLGAANPWGVTVSPDNSKVFVAHAGTREVSIIDRAKLRSQLDMAQQGIKVTEVTRKAQDVPNDLSFLSGIRRRVTFPADGPRGIVATDSEVFTVAYFADALIRIPYNERILRPVVYPLGKELLDLSKDRVLRGEMLFNDASMCFQQWQSCATCHPDGLVDGLNWDLLNDGIGNPKQTKSLYLSGFTPPTMITGIRKDMEHCNRAGIRHIQFCERPEEDPLCVDAYVMAMQAQVSPYARDTVAVARGAIVFEKAGCATCHTPATYYTDMKQYDLGLGTRSEEGRKFDTPTLHDVWRTAPYLYDGRAKTMREMLTTFNPKDTHGVTSNLTAQELDDLCTFTLSL